MGSKVSLPTIWRTHKTWSRSFLLKDFLLLLPKRPLRRASAVFFAYCCSQVKSLFNWCSILVQVGRSVTWQKLNTAVQQTTILDKIKWNSKPPSPPKKIKDEAARRAKTRHFRILDLGGGAGGRSRFSIYFVQDCTSMQDRSLPVPLRSLLPQTWA